MQHEQFEEPTEQANGDTSLGTLPVQLEMTIPERCTVFEIGHYFVYLNREKQHRCVIEQMQSFWEVSQRRAPDSEREGLILYVSGAAGTGKTTFCRKLLHEEAKKLSEDEEQPFKRGMYLCAKHRLTFRITCADLGAELQAGESCEIVLARRLLYEFCKEEINTPYHSFVVQTPAAFFRGQGMAFVVALILEKRKIDGVPLITINLDETNQLIRANKTQVLISILQAVVNLWGKVEKAVLFFTLSGTHREELRKAISASSSARPKEVFLPPLTINHFSKILANLVARCLPEGSEETIYEITQHPGLQVLMAGAAGNPRLLGLLISLLSLVGKELDPETGLWREAKPSYHGLQFYREGLKQFYLKIKQLEPKQLDDLLNDLPAQFNEVVNEWAPTYVHDVCSLRRKVFDQLVLHSLFRWPARINDELVKIRTETEDSVTPSYLEKRGLAVLGQTPDGYGYYLQLPLALLRASERTMIGGETVMSSIGKAARSLLDRTSVATNECLDLAIVGARLYSFYLQGRRTCTVAEILGQFWKSSTPDPVAVKVPQSHFIVRERKRCTAKTFTSREMANTVGFYKGPAHAEFCDSWITLERADGVPRYHSILIQTKKDAERSPLSLKSIQYEHDKCRLPSDGTHSYSFVFCGDGPLAPAQREGLQPNEYVIDSCIQEEFGWTTKGSRRVAKTESSEGDLKRVMDKTTTAHCEAFTALLKREEEEEKKEAEKEEVSHVTKKDQGKNKKRKRMEKEQEEEVSRVKKKDKGKNKKIRRGG